MSTIKHDITM